MGHKRLKNREKIRKIAWERIEILFKGLKRLRDLEIHSRDIDKMELARRRVLFARKIAMRVRKPLPREYRRQFCRSCNSPLIFSDNVRVRLQGSGKGAHVVVTCLTCGRIYGYHYKKSKVKKAPRTG